MRVLADQPTEVFAMLCLSTKHRVIAYHEVSRGTLDTTLVHPRDVFKAAVLANAAAIIVAHYVARHIMQSIFSPMQSIFSPAARQQDAESGRDARRRDGGLKMDRTKPLPGCLAYGD
jgi:hypothetical protein